MPERTSISLWLTAPWAKAKRSTNTRKALAIDPDYVPAYLNWGSALFSKQQYDDAAQIYRKGIQVNPLLASLHYNLSLTLERLNKMQEANTEKALAVRLDPKKAEQR
jgi:tetratricopeptide (TPR) repeat protein